MINPFSFHPLGMSFQGTTDGDPSSGTGGNPSDTQDNTAAKDMEEDLQDNDEMDEDKERAKRRAEKESKRRRKKRTKSALTTKQAPTTQPSQPLAGALAFAPVPPSIETSSVLMGGQPEVWHADDISIDLNINISANNDQQQNVWAEDDSLPSFKST